MAMVATGTTIEPDTAVPNYPGIPYQDLLQLRAVAVGYAHSDGLFSSSQKKTKCSCTSLPPLLMNNVYHFRHSPIAPHPDRSHQYSDTKTFPLNQRVRDVFKSENVRASLSSSNQMIDEHTKINQCTTIVQSV